MHHGPPSIWEWAAAGAGGILVVLVIGFMAYEAATLGPHPSPHLATRIDTIVPTAGSYLVEFQATNTGDATAAHVVIHGELHADTGFVERSEATLDFVPARSSRQGGLVFRSDPRRYRLVVRAVGFSRP
jgi:uncharacterized protein (TIGR02588 family)